MYPRKTINQPSAVKKNDMCLSETLKKILQISSILSELTVAKMDITKNRLVPDNPEISDGMEEDYKDDVFPETVDSKIIEAFILIMQLLFITPSSEKEWSTIMENANSYLIILKDIVVDLPGYKKKIFGLELLSDFQQAQNIADEQKNDELSKNLMLCKRAIFE